jgi:hypothetical protein
MKLNILKTLLLMVAGCTLSSYLATMQLKQNPNIKKTISTTNKSEAYYKLR